MRLRAFIVGLIIFTLGAGVAFAASSTLNHTKTITVAAGKTESAKVGYPDALQFGGAKYSGTVKILAPSASASKVHVLSKHSCNGGSDLCVKVKNDNSAAVGVKVTATTKLPLGGGY